MWIEIFKFEILYRLRRVETYLFFLVVFLFSIVAFNFIFEGQNLGQLKENAPYIIGKVMAISSGIFMLITSMVMGVPILRDFQYEITPLIFVNPIKKYDYLLGHYLGSFTILILIFSGLIWGMLLGEHMPWRDSHNLLPFSFWNYLRPFLILVLPTLFVSGSIFFVSGALSRKLLVVYTQGLIFFMLTVLSFAVKDETVAALLEPLAYTALDNVMQFKDLPQQNALAFPIAGVLLGNRLIWIALGLLALAKGYYSFSFSTKTKTVKAKTDLGSTTEYVSFAVPAFSFKKGYLTQLSQLRAQSLFYFQSILKEPTFWAVIICGAITIFINSINIGTSYDVDSFPTTYLIVEELQEMSIWFFLIILIFYVGELIWAEKGVKINGIYDSLPISDFVILAGKFIGITLVYIFLLLTLMLSGIAFQAASGYYDFQLSVYFAGLFLEILPFLTLFTFIAFFFQVISNSKFIGHILVLVFFVSIMAMGLLGFDHGLYKFGGIALEAYSEMNGYGHFIKPYLWFKAYWFAICFLLFAIAVIFPVRGNEMGFKTRWRLARQRLTKPLVFSIVGILLFTLLTGGYIFYNTNILNQYLSNSEQETFRVAYENTLKQYEYQAQPKIVDIKLELDLYPNQREYNVEGYYVLENQTDESIYEVHLQKRIGNYEKLEYVSFEREFREDNQYENFDYFIYQLDQPLSPGDSIRMNFRQTSSNYGFEANSNPIHLVENGTFFSNDRFPSLGYNKNYELPDEKDRNQHDLPTRSNKANREDSRELGNGRTGGDGSKTNFEIVIGTEPDQTAIAPGYLLKEWLEDDRKYFHFKMDKPMINFYSIVSARYEVLDDKWSALSKSSENSVDLAIYYNKGHEYNLESMMNSMKKSLSYFNSNFNAYPYRQLRIMEFPRYAEFAQSFPNTIPYSEALGFILDVDDKQDVDIPFYVTAHEVAHQWWGMNLVAANVKGKNMILETLAQYSALMVLKDEYPEEKVTQFLQLQLERYLRGRRISSKKEVPLELVENEKYIYYSKGAINMFALQDYISEDSVNSALKMFLQDWNVQDGELQKDQYPTTKDLLGYFEQVTPDSLQYLLRDLFKTVTVFDNEAIKGSFAKKTDNHFEVKLEVGSRKFRVDSSGAEQAIPIDDWIEIGAYSNRIDGEKELIYLKKHQFSSTHNELIIHVEQLPSHVAIDPLIKLIDKKKDNNVIEVSLESVKD